MEYLTTEELAKELKVTRQTVYNWRKSGLPSYKFGRSVRFIRQDVEGWIKTHYQEGQVTK